MQAANFHTLLEPVGKSTLLGRGTLGEGNRTTKGTSSCAVADTHDADIVDASNSCIASHTGRHLNLHLELGVGRQRDALDTQTRDVLSDSGRLHGSFISATRRAINVCCKRTRTILVDLKAVRKLTVPSSAQVGNPPVAPAPAAAATLASGGPSTLSPPPPNKPAIPVAPPAPPAAPAPPAPPPFPPPRLPKRLLRNWRLRCVPAPAFCAFCGISSSTPTLPDAPWFAGGAAPDPMNAPTMTEASTLPLPCVRPKGPVLPLAISRSRMMAVSAWEPHPLFPMLDFFFSSLFHCLSGRLRGVETYLDEQSLGVPSWIVKPGMETPFAPLISVTTPWAEMLVAAVRARRKVRGKYIVAAFSSSRNSNR